MARLKLIQRGERGKKEKGGGEKTYSDHFHYGACHIKVIVGER